MNPMCLGLPDNFEPFLRLISLFLATYQKFGRGFFRYLKIIGPKILKMVKNAPILLIFGVIKSFGELFLHTKYEPNRSIFDLARVFSEPSKCSKMLRSCSNLVWWILFMSCFSTPNMSKIGAFLTFLKILGPIILPIRKNAPPNFWYVALNRLIYLKSGPKLSGQCRNIELIFDWDIIFQKVTVRMCLGLGPNYLTRIDHHWD